MPDPSLSLNEVRKVARLARLALTDVELADAQRRLSAIIGYMERLKQVDLTGVEPLVHVGGETNVLRDDEPGQALPTQALLDMAPETWENFVKVPKVIDGGEGA